MKKIQIKIQISRWVVDTVFPHIVSAETILFLDLEIQRSQYIRPKVTIHKCELYEEIRYIWLYGLYSYK